MLYKFVKNISTYQITFANQVISIIFMEIQNGLLWQFQIKQNCVQVVMFSVSSNPCVIPINPEAPHKMPTDTNRTHNHWKSIRGGSSFCYFSFFFRIRWTLVTHWISPSYLTGVTVTQLQWNLSNMNVIWEVLLNSDSSLSLIYLGSSQ